MLELIKRLRDLVERTKGNQYEDHCRLRGMLDVLLAMEERTVSVRYLGKYGIDESRVPEFIAMLEKA